MRPLGTIRRPAAPRGSLVGIEDSGPPPPPSRRPSRGGGMTRPPGRRGRRRRKRDGARGGFLTYLPSGGPPDWETRAWGIRNFGGFPSYIRDRWSGTRHLTTRHTVLPNARNTGKTRYQRGMQSYSQKSQVSHLLGSGPPKVLPKEPTERLKLVAAAVAAISAPPPKRTHTGTTKGGASSSGSGKDRIPDPRIVLGFPPPRGAIPTMASASGVGGGSSSALPHGPGVGQADVAMADARPAPAAAAQQSALALSVPSVDLTEDGPGPEVRSGTRTQAPRLARTAASHRPTLVLPQEQAALVAVAADALHGLNPAVALPDTPSGSGIEVQAELVLCPWAEGLGPDDRPVLDAAWKYLGPFDQEQVAYALLRLLKDSEVDDKPRFDRVRTGALAVLSATYRRLQAGEALRAAPYRGGCSG